MSPTEAGRPLEGRVALVTGASRGIGVAAAVRLAEAGASVAVTARTLDAEPDAKLPGSLTETLAAIEATGAKALAVVADLADPDDRDRIVPEVEAGLGPIDVLVNNAAAAIYAPVAELPRRRRQIIFEVNAHAPVDLAQGVVPGMRQRGHGWIVNVSSATSKHPVPPYARVNTTMTAYGASKAALERYTAGLAAELHADGIAVNSIAPVSAVRTPGADTLVGDYLDAHPEIVEPASYLAEAILYLSTCSPAECTGQILYSRPLLEKLGRLPAS